MKVEVEDVSSIKKTLTIEIPKEQVARELNTAYNTLKKTAKIKGFRPGKAPRSVLENYFRKDVHEDVTGKLIEESFPEAIKEKELKMVGTPKLDPPALDPNEPYIYKATFEIYPEIENIDIKGFSLKKNLYLATDNEIDVQLKMIQKNLSSLEPISEDRPVQEKDVILIDYEVFKDGQPFEGIGKAEKYSLTVGNGQISLSFDDGLIGMKPGDQREIVVHFPEEYQNKALADQEVTFKVDLHEIRKEILPEIDDEMAKKAGNYENLDALKSVIRENLTQGYNKRVEQELNEQIFSHIIEKTTFELPEAMVEYELEGIISEAERSFYYQNVSMEDLGLTRDALAERYRETAEKQVRRHLILDKMITQESLSLTDEELDAGYSDMAKTLNQPIEDIKQFYKQQKDQLEYFKHSLLEKKAIKLIIDNGVVTEVVPELETNSGEAPEK